MNLGAGIRKIRKEKKWTLKEMKQRTGLSISFLSDIERGVSKPSLNKLEIIADTLGVSISYLLKENVENKDKQGYAPVLYTIKDMQYTVLEESRQEYHKIDLQKQDLPDGNYFFIKMQDDSMKESGIFPESLVLIRKQNFIKDGELALIKIKNTNHLIRKVYKNNQTIILQAANNKYETKLYPLDEIKILGKVISTRYYFD